MEVTHLVLLFLVCVAPDPCEGIGGPVPLAAVHTPGAAGHIVPVELMHPPPPLDVPSYWFLLLLRMPAKVMQHRLGRASCHFNYLKDVILAHLELGKGTFTHD